MSYKKQGRKKAFNLMKVRAERANKETARPKTGSGVKKVIKLASVKDVLAPLTVPYALIGGHAVSILGHQRTTSDIDVLVAPHDMEEAAEALESQGAQRGNPLSIGGISLTMPGGTEVDIVSPDEPWVSDAISASTGSPYGQVVTRPWLVLMKMWASRGLQEDTDMVYMIKAMPDEEKEETRRLFGQWLPSDIDDLEQMVELSQYT
jgi:hypothetical protein